MIASKNYHIKTTEKELETLIWESVYRTLNCSLGTGNLIWEKGTELPWYVTRLEELRGITTENMNGEGV